MRIKVYKDESIRLFQTNVLSDLMKPIIFEHGHKNLKGVFKDLLLKEKVDLFAMTKPEKNKFNEGSQVERWMDLYSADSPVKLKSNRIKEKKDYFNNLVKRYGNQNFKEVISNLMDKKFARLNNLRYRTF